MADPGKPIPPSRSPEPNLERRLLLTFVLMGLVLLASQYLFKPPRDQNKPTVKTAEAPKPAKQTTPPPAQPPLSTTATPAAKVAATDEQTYRIDTDLFTVQLSNRGGEVRSWVLKKYHTSDGKPLELVNQPGAKAVNEYPFALAFNDPKFPDVNHALFAAAPTADGLGIEYTFSDGQISVRKQFQFTKNSYLVHVLSEVLRSGSAVPHFLVWRAGFGDPSTTNASAQQQTVYYDATAGKLVRNDVKVAKDAPATAAGNYTFAGLQDAYFAAVFLPQEANSVEIKTVSDSVASPYSEQAAPHIGAEVGGSGVNHFTVFVGPKDYYLLRSVDPRLEQLVDFGRWFGFLAKPLFLAVPSFNNAFVNNYGWSIVIVTIIINLALFPLRISSMKSMRKMAALQPEIAKINEKYKGIGLRDPKKADQNTELMALYKRHGVNPIGGGCFPMVLQLPFFIAFYTVLTVAIEMRGAQWLWVRDLSQYDPYYLLPIIMIVTQFAVQRLTPQTGTDPTQQKMMMFMMPLMMGFFFMKASAGLVLYWLTGNVVSLVQQWFFNKFMPAPAPAVVDVRPVGKKSRK